MSFDEILAVTSPTDALGELGGWVRTERQRVRWTQSELSRRSGVPSATISRLELTGLASTDAFLKILFALNRLDGFVGYLKEHHRLAEIPTTLQEASRTKPVLRVRTRKGTP